MRSANRFQVATGHALATATGVEILEAGGNAIDAGVGAGLALSILHSDEIQVSGTAPMMLYLARTREVRTIAGVGRWPARASVEYFEKHHGGRIPLGVCRQIVPGTPGAWILALARYGTWSFSDVCRSAIELAADGFRVGKKMQSRIRTFSKNFRLWPLNASLYLPGGQPLAEGEWFVQTDLSRALQYMADEERSAVARQGSRAAGLRAVWRSFYTGDIARAFVDYHRENGGLLTREDMARFRAREEGPVRFRFRGYDIHTCGPWSQAPVILQTLSMLSNDDLGGLQHNGAAYVHLVVEAMKLAYADRERFYGDPDFVRVPLDILLGAEYSRRRRGRIDARVALDGLPPPEPFPGHGEFDYRSPGRENDPEVFADTSYLCVVDERGNVFSATPSDPTDEAPIVPGTGMSPSPRGGQAFVSRGHPNAVEPGKRPRVTPSLALAVKPGGEILALGGPGADNSPQAMLQVLLNYLVFGFGLQEATEKSRFVTSSFPSSWDPHPNYPDRLHLEKGIGEKTRDALEGLGHRASLKPARWSHGGAVWAIVRDLRSGRMTSGVDPREEATADGA